MFQSFFYILIIIISPKANNNCDINTIRNEYHQLDSKEKIENFIHKIESCKDINLQSYIAAATMQKAIYTSWPPKKLTHFNKGKEMLEAFIHKNPKSIDARYLRVLTQSNCPSFLGYKKNIKEDLQFIEKEIHTLNSEAEFTKKLIKNISEIKKNNH